MCHNLNIFQDENSLFPQWTDVFQTRTTLIRPARERVGADLDGSTRSVGIHVAKMMKIIINEKLNMKNVETAKTRMIRRCKEARRRLGGGRADTPLDDRCNSLGDPTPPPTAVADGVRGTPRPPDRRPRRWGEVPPPFIFIK